MEYNNYNKKSYPGASPNAKFTVKSKFNSDAKFKGINVFQPEQQIDNRRKSFNLT